MNKKISPWILPIFIGVILGWFSKPIFGPYVTHYIDSLLNNNKHSNSSNSTRLIRAQKNVHSTTDELKTLINRGEYRRFFENYESIFFTGEDDLITASKDIFLDHIDEIMVSNQLQKAGDLLKLFLETDTNNIDAQLALAEVFEHQKKFDAAIKRLYSARSYAHRPTELEKIIGKIRACVEQYDKQLITLKHKHGLLELYQMLTSIEPDYAPYLMKLAEIQVDIGDFTSATESLNTIAYDPVFGEQATTILKKLGESEPQLVETYETVIPLVRLGNHYLVQAVVNEVDILNLILDTGASLTSIKPQVLTDLGIDPWSSTDIRKLSTANGVVDAPVTILPILSVGEQVIEDIEVAVINITETPDIDGLLGMNFLQNYKFFIDQSKEVLVLSPAL